jgi:hypothetical protein
MSNYDFKTLSPTDFERLVADLLNADLGLRLQGFPEGRDQGIDLRDATPDSVTIVQCKHFARSSYGSLLTAAGKEVAKAGRKTANRYLLVTSRALTPPQQSELAKTLNIPAGDVWGQRALNDALTRNPDVERRCFKLWLPSTGVLESIINAGRWNRSTALLEDVADRAKYWVETEAYAAVTSLLESDGACLIAGPPGLGKTFLAEIMALRESRDGWEVVDLAGEVQNFWAAIRNGVKQLFIYDDFLGQAELSITAASEAGSLVSFVRYIRRHKDLKHLIMTNRDYVLGQAASAASERLRHVSSDPARIAITLSTYGPSTRAEMLFNHLYFADLDPQEQERFAVDSRMMTIIQHLSFSPRTIDMVVRGIGPSVTAGEVLDQIIRTFDDPAELWAVSFDALTPLARSILLTLATLPPRPTSHDDLRTLVASDCGTMEWQDAMRSLESTWIILRRSEAHRPVSFSNPSCRDYVLGRLNDIDLARDQIGRVQRIEQLVSLSQSADLLTSEGVIQTTARRPELAAALQGQRTYIVDLTRNFAEQLTADMGGEIAVAMLRDAAALLSIYGSPDDTAWLLDRIATLTADGGLIDRSSTAAVLPSVSGSGETPGATVTGGNLRARRDQQTVTMTSPQVSTSN